MSARRALRYAAELRFPGDTSKRERNGRVDEVIDELGLKAHAETRAASLSGGQQKRVNVALELLTKPSLLFLDEPTSGLDPGLDKSVMEMMSGLAKDGRTVIVVTHSVANLDVCDRLLVLVPGGRVAFFGPPAEGLKHFGKPGWAEVFQAFDQEPDRDWAAEFKRSPLYAQYVTAGLAARCASGQPQGDSAAAQAAQSSRAAQHSRQAVHRGHRLRPRLPGLSGRGTDRPRPGDPGDPALAGLGGRTGTNDAAEQLLQVLVLCACFAGAFNAVRELVKERAIYSRERAAGLSAGAYLSSKLVVLGLSARSRRRCSCSSGCTAARSRPTGLVLKALPLAELMLAICALAVVSMALGLLISASVNTSEKAMPLLLVPWWWRSSSPEAVFALNGKAGLEQVAWLSPSRWGFAAPASTADLRGSCAPSWDQAGSAVAAQRAHLAEGHGGSLARCRVHPAHLVATGAPQPRPQTVKTWF